MNKLFTIFILFIWVAISFAQKQEKMVTVPESMLSQDQKAKLEVKQHVESAKEWGGIGKEIGEGAKAIFEALNKNAVEFGESTPGLFLIGILAWHVVGTDFLQFIFGVPLWLIGTLLFAYSYYKTCIPRKICVSKKLKKEGKIFNRYDKEYKIINIKGDSEYSSTPKAVERASHFGFYMIFTLVCIAVIFI